MEEFGAFVRRERERRGISLRDMAKRIGVSPTYQSKVERGEFPPPAEDKVKRIAEIIECNSDRLLALAGRVASELTEIIKRQPTEFAVLLRTAKSLSPQRIERLIGEAKKERDR